MVLISPSMASNPYVIVFCIKGKALSLIKHAKENKKQNYKWKHGLQRGYIIEAQNHLTKHEIPQKCNIGE